jgi:hypothetical protein
MSSHKATPPVSERSARQVYAPEDSDAREAARLLMENHKFP